MDATFIFASESHGPSPLKPEAAELLWGVLSTGFLVLAVVAAVLLIAYLLSALRRGE